MMLVARGAVLIGKGGYPGFNSSKLFDKSHRFLAGPAAGLTRGSFFLFAVLRGRWLSQIFHPSLLAETMKAGQGELGQTIRCLVNGKVIHASVILVVDVGNGDVCYRGVFVATLF